MAPKPPILPGQYQYVKRLEVFPKTSSIFDQCSHDGNYDFMKNEENALEKGARGGDNDNTLKGKYPYDWITKMASALGDDKLEIFRLVLFLIIPILLSLMQDIDGI
jgi:hypothetical protein